MFGWYRGMSRLRCDCQGYRVSLRQEAVSQYHEPRATEPRPRRGLLTDNELLRLMLTSRETDLREAILMRQGKGWLQVPAMGHEALAAFAELLEPEDLLFPYYRDRALLLARGISAETMAADFYARRDSTSRGRNMPVHSTDRRLGIFSPATPTGVQCLPAVGAAWGLKLAQRPQVVLCTIGDAATRQGEFYEAVCFAIQEQLPIVFVVEDNQYGISTPTRNMLPLRLGVFDAKILASLNGRDVREILQKGGDAIRRARRREGPTVLWCTIDRMASHTNSDDHRIYRTAEDIQAMRDRDPIEAWARRLQAEGRLSPSELDEMRGEIVAYVDRIYLEAEATPLPDPGSAMEHLFGPSVPHRPLVAASAEGHFGPRMTMVEGIQHVLRQGLLTDPRTVLLGQDIEDPKGGVFGFTKGLSTEFPDRVFNAPLAEATIVGAGVGMAATGFRPVFEIQFIDFLTPAFHQLVNQVANLRWRSAGDWTCPMVIYAPYGAYLPAGGIWHSQSNEGWWTHVPGLRVAIPSTVEDVAGLLWSAMQDEDPSLVLVPKHLARQRVVVTELHPIRWGDAVLRRSGADVTLVAWGNCLELAELAAQRLELEGIDLEIVDPRTLVPCDWEAIEKSVAKTGRLVVLHEDGKTAGFGQAIVSEMCSVPQRFNYFLSAPQLVATPDVYIPFCPTLEYAVLPDLERLLKAINATME